MPWKPYKPDEIPQELLDINAELLKQAQRTLDGKNDDEVETYGQFEYWEDEEDEE